METEVLEETETVINQMVTSVMRLHLKDDIQEEIIKMPQNLLRNTTILQEKLLLMEIRFYLRTTYNILNTFHEFLCYKKIQEIMWKI